MENTEITNLIARLAKYKIAFAHDYLIKNGGAENCLVQLHELFPKAPVYTLIYDEAGTRSRYKDWHIHTSYLQHRPLVKKLINYYRLFMPQAVESFDFSEFDIVISGASSFIKGIITKPKTFHICYLHTPTRFLWINSKSHIERGQFSGLIKQIVPYFLHKVRIWDSVAAARPDVIIANSNTTRSRIAKYYRRESSVIYPPVNINNNDYKKRVTKDYFLVISRLEPHKDIDIAIKAAKLSKKKLKIVGEGSDISRLKSIADDCTEFIGHVSEKDKIDLYLGAKAFLAPQLEDFGITMVEALSLGCPVIARGDGGAKEIVHHGKTGILLSEMNAKTLAGAMDSQQIDKFNAETCFSSVTKFSTENFKINFLKEILKNVR